MGKMTDFLENIKDPSYLKNERVKTGLNWTKYLVEILRSKPKLERKLEKEIDEGTFSSMSPACTEISYELIQKAGNAKVGRKYRSRNPEFVSGRGKKVKQYLKYTFINYIPQYKSFYNSVRQ